jgi:hypothetical protein
MFDSLDETMKHDEQSESSPREKLVRYVILTIGIVVAVGGLLLGIRYLE